VDGVRVIRKNHGRGHSYVDLDTNEKLPGVTTITGGGTPKDALTNWAGDATAAYAVDNWDALTPLGPAAKLTRLKKGRYEDRDAAGKRGTEVHALGERLIKDERVTVPDELVGHVNAYTDFLNEFQAREVFVEGPDGQQHAMTEAVVYSEKGRYVGTLDLIADIMLPDMREYEDIPRDTDGFVRSLLDLKTSRSGIFGETALQISGYRYCDVMILGDARTMDNPSRMEIDMPHVDFTAAIHIRSDGYDLIPVKADEETFLSFRYVRQVYLYDQSSRDLVGAPIVPPTASAYRLVKAED
jgi:hypothetical protein